MFPTPTAKSVDVIIQMSDVGWMAWPGMSRAYCGTHQSSLISLPEAPWQREGNDEREDDEPSRRYWRLTESSLNSVRTAPGW